MFLPVRGKTRRMSFPMLFSLFLNDIEEEFIKSGIEGLDVNLFKVFMILYQK